ncbi:hypothetical protein KHA80_09315 [Anaerobacillus sp. HL2]|nr:hypothetical protein KHA80_09315 [Anaerobacillus sp. HL2]
MTFSVKTSMISLILRGRRIEVIYVSKRLNYSYGRKKKKLTRKRFIEEIGGYLSVIVP